MSGVLLPSTTHTHKVSDVRNYNLDAIAAPLPTDGASSGYEVGSQWVVQSANAVYECTDANDPNARWQLLNNLVTPETFGAVGDGVADDSQAMQDFVNAAQTQPGNVYAFSNRTYAIATTITATAPFVINGNGATILNQTTDNYFITVTGASDSAILLTSNAVAGDLDLDLASVANIVVGDWLYLSSTQVWSTNIASTYGEWVQVKSVAALTVTLYSPVLFGYATASSAQVVRTVLVNGVWMNNFNVIGSGAGNQKALSFDRCQNVSVNNVNISLCNERGIQLSRCLQCKITGCFIEKANAAGLSYGISIINGCAFMIVSNCIGNDLRHLVTIGGVQGVNRYITVADSIALASRDAGFDAHPSSQFVIFDSLQVEGAPGSGNQDGIAMQGVAMKCANIQLSSVFRHGVLVSALTTGLSAINYTAVANITGQAAHTLVFIQALEDGFSSVTVDNVCGSADTNLVQFTAQDGNNITNFAINNCRSNEQLPGRGIRLFANTGVTITNGTITNCSLSLASVANNEGIYLHAISATSFTDVRLIGNRVLGGTIGIRGVNTNFIQTACNRVTGYSVSGITIAGANNSLGSAADLTA